MSHLVVTCWFCGKDYHTPNDGCEPRKCHGCSQYYWVLTDSCECFRCLLQKWKTGALQSPVELLNLVIRHTKSEKEAVNTLPGMNESDFDRYDAAENGYHELFRQVFQDDEKISNLLPYLKVTDGISQSTHITISDSPVNPEDQYHFYY